MKGIVIAGIGTGIGKTFISSILVEMWHADYWKPVQAGNLDFTDTDFVKKHITNHQSFFHQEGYRLSEPMSPHAAAQIDEVQIFSRNLNLPSSENLIIVEAAGGIMVPLNDKELNIDLFTKWDLPVILVSKNYLGSINHTLLSIQLLKDRGIHLYGIIFNGEANQYTENFILQYSGVRCLAKIGHEENINKMLVKKYADEWKDKMESIQ